MARRYVILDVFTDMPLAGNPLAVVLDGEGLDDRQMQRIAAEFNLSETVFVTAAERPVHAARLRIFTPARELPFAGHPTVGTAVLLAAEGRSGEDDRDAVLVLEEAIGPVRCGVTLRGAVGRAVFDAPSLPVERPLAGDTEAIAAALGLIPAELGFENHQPSVFDAALPFTFVPVRDLDVIRKVAPQPAGWVAAFGPGSHNNAYVYCRETAIPGRSFHARMLAPSLGIGEDPATGSAAVALAGVVRKFDTPPAGLHVLAIEQGYEMGRPSLIELEIEIVGTEVGAIRIAGSAVEVARGTLSV